MFPGSKPVLHHSVGITRLLLNTSASLTWKTYDVPHSISTDVCMLSCYVLQKRRKFHCTENKTKQINIAM